MRDVASHYEELKDKLDALSSQLGAHLRDLHERGEFTEEHRALIADITRRQEQFRKKVANVEANGAAWDLIKSETQRDFSSLLDNLLQINEQLDADDMKSRYGYFSTEDHRR